MSDETRIPATGESAPPRPVWVNLGFFVLALVAGAVTYYLMPDAMEEGARRMAAIFALAVVLWVTEAIPLFATSLCVIALQSAWVALDPDVGGALEYRAVFNSLSNPVIYLFLGGFVLAKAVQKEYIDVQMAALLLRAFGTRPRAVLAGIMIITAVFSMWMSNTATTAMMIIMVQPFLGHLPAGDPFRKALILSVPFAANIGGIGTPIGTPPNAIAIAQLEQMGLGISFLTWMVFAIPLMLGSLFLMWLLLVVMFRPQADVVHVEITRGFKLTPHAMVVYGTFAATVLLWLTGAWHGVPSAVVAMLPAAVLTLSRVISRQDFNQLEWNILVLIAGGIALGDGITSTGLDRWIVDVVPGDGMTFITLAAVIGGMALLLSTVISNSVATMILLPIGLALAATMETGDTGLQVLAVLCAIMASYAMSLPISTPPNAIAYSTGQIENRDMLIVGGITSAVAGVFVILTGPTVIAAILNLLQ